MNGFTVVLHDNGRERLSLDKDENVTVAPMAQPRRGRPPSPVDPEASRGARLGFEIRKRRNELDLTLEALGKLTAYTAQYISEVERAKTTPAQPFIAACECALDAHGELEPLLTPVLQERERQRQERAAARRSTDPPSLPCEDRSEAVGDDEDVGPTNRRGLLGAGAAAALGTAALSAAPTQARQIDSELPAHSARLLDQLARLDDAFGPQDLLDTVRHEFGRLAAHAKAARGEVHTELLRVEARWAEFAAWLSNDTGRWRERDAWTECALRLAHDAGCADVIALARMRQGQWAIQAYDAPRSVTFTEEALRTSGASLAIRARCALRAAHGHALANDAASCERKLAVAAEAVEAGVRTYGVTPGGISANTARCWLYLKPERAVALYEDALRTWPRDQVRDHGLHQARFARACAKAGDLERARGEGRKALMLQRATKSATAERELQRLGQELRVA